ncbi:hypothetical protein BKA62DRAFT_769087 [Auriculariales sp. MPI-PUGE-AT-0066]|nr:hypothetical protein BKA62DRAFT_769087 [Auriculariales sp. MPI-PUGE-AT-0066]
MSQDSTVSTSAISDFEAATREIVASSEGRRSEREHKPSLSPPQLPAKTLRKQITALEALLSTANEDLSRLTLQNNHQQLEMKAQETLATNLSLRLAESQLQLKGAHALISESKTALEDRQSLTDLLKVAVERLEGERDRLEVENTFLQTSKQFLAMTNDDISARLFRARARTVVSGYDDSEVDGSRSGDESDEDTATVDHVTKMVEGLEIQLDAVSSSPEPDLNHASEKTLEVLAAELDLVIHQRDSAIECAKEFTGRLRDHTAKLKTIALQCKYARDVHGDIQACFKCPSCFEPMLDPRTSLWTLTLRGMREQNVYAWSVPLPLCCTVAAAPPIVVIQLVSLTNTIFKSTQGMLHIVETIEVDHNPDACNSQH